MNQQKDGEGGKMLWFKHDTQKHRKPLERKLITRYGAEAYGLFLNIEELIGEDVKAWRPGNGYLGSDVDEEYLSEESRIPVEKITEYIDGMVELGLLKMKRGKIFHPEILKRCDEYTKKQTREPARPQKVSKKEVTKEACPDSVRTMSGIEVEVEVEVEEYTSSSSSISRHAQLVDNFQVQFNQRTAAVARSILDTLKRYRVYLSLRDATHIAVYYLERGLDETFTTHLMKTCAVRGYKNATGWFLRAYQFPDQQREWRELQRRGQHIRARPPRKCGICGGILRYAVDLCMCIDCKTVYEYQTASDRWLEYSIPKDNIPEQRQASANAVGEAARVNQEVNNISTTGIERGPNEKDCKIIDFRDTRAPKT